MTTNQIHPADVRVVPDWELCDRLRRSMRLVPDMSNEDIAEIMGVRRETISTWLGGRRMPPKTTVMVWADMTGVDQEWLLTGTPSEYAMRDLNPQPADFPLLRLVHAPGDPRPHTPRPRPTAVNPRFTPNRRSA